MASVLNPGTLENLKTAGFVQEAVALKITELQENNGKIKCELSDGKENMPGVITSQVHFYVFLTKYFKYRKRFYCLNPSASSTLRAESVKTLLPSLAGCSAVWRLAEEQ